MPLPVLPTCLSALTLSNIYGGLGFTWLRVFIMTCGMILVLCYVVKMVTSPGTCLKEYDQTIPASLYGAFSMCLMVLGSFLYEKGLGFGKGLWLFAVIIHFVHILVFTKKHTYGRVITKRDLIPMMPSWFVTYNGWMVACVTGSAMNMGWLLKIITVYGCIICPILLVIILYRLFTKEIKPGTYHTMAILMAPCCLCVVSLINVFEEPNPVVLWGMYILVLIFMLFLIFKLPDFFSFDFYPGYAALTFPMAIGVVATQKMAGYLAKAGKEGLSAAATQLSGFQLLLTSMLVGYVVLMFIRMLLGKGRRT